MECMPVMYFMVHVNNLCLIFVFVFYFVILFKVYDYFAIISRILMIFGGKNMAFTCLEVFFFVDAPP